MRNALKLVLVSAALGFAAGGTAEAAPAISGAPAAAAVAKGSGHEATEVRHWRRHWRRHHWRGYHWRRHHWRRHRWRRHRYYRPYYRPYYYSGYYYPNYYYAPPAYYGPRVSIGVGF